MKNLKVGSRLPSKLAKQVRKYWGGFHIQMNDPHCGYYWIKGVNKDFTDYFSGGVCESNNEFWQKNACIIVERNNSGGFTIVFLADYLTSS